ncbi:lipopolysaccharide biosynthesis protein [Methanolobus sp. ZRKC5]|uniref:lipopolysaccharide biosynthesis protein n=1 Tax=unclassified Methanolobus TaxID=2629569 RepID=UPI00313DD68C
MSLRKKAYSGIWWVIISTIFSKLINLLTNISLARLLDPSHFGIVALALVFINFFETFRDLGIGSALIHRSDNNSIAQNTAFFIFPFAAVFFYILCYLISPYVALFFKSDGLDLIIKVLSLSLILWSFGNLPTTLLAKELEFKKLLYPQIVPKLGYALVSIVLAIQGFGVWSLVIGRISLEILSLIIVWHVIDWRPKLEFDKKTAVELLKYGKYVLGTSLIAFLSSVFDVVVIGRELGAETLGFYSIALTVASFFTIQISHVIYQVVFPVFSKLQHDMDKMKSVFLNSLKYLSFFIFPSAAGIIVVSNQFINVFYGSKWLPAVPLIQILCIYGSAQSISKVTSSVYLASGTPHKSTMINILHLFFIMILIYPLTIAYGVVGTSLAVTISSTISLFFSLNQVKKILLCSYATIFKVLVYPFVGSIAMFIFVILIQELIYLYSDIFIFIVSMISGISFYLLFLLCVQFKEIKTIANYVSNYLILKS